MIASDSFVLRGNVNLVFPSLLTQAGNLVEDNGFLYLLIFPQISYNMGG